MSKFEDFIVEIGTEELPPKDLQTLATSFAENLKASLTEAGIGFAATKVFASPRRLAVLIKDLPTHQPDQIVKRSGPSIKAAYNADGTPTKAAEGFAISAGVALANMTEVDGKLYAEKTLSGQKTIDLLPAMVEKAVTKLPIKKAMRWGNGDFSFVRPVHWLLMLFGTNVVKAKIFGIESSNYTYGHRIHSPKPIKITSPDQYEEELIGTGKVFPDFETRKELILYTINELAAEVNGTPVIDPQLLETVCGLVEFPMGLIANFNPDYLRVPKECLISSMQDHQKCFALTDKHGKLLPKFILIANLSSSDPKTVVHGNELVMNARLADAAFYFDKDQETPLTARTELLKTVIYQKQLGSIYDKVLRIGELAEYIAPFVHADPYATKRAAFLCKADLLTNMVYEFPELQGIMGYYYAKHDKEPADVANAIQEHYKPRFAQDELPESAIGTCLAVADRVDSLVGFFGIVGSIPTGEKDPYGLRRQALAILRILIEKDINIDLDELFLKACENYNVNFDYNSQLMPFCFERLKAWYMDKNVPAKTFAAVMASKPTRPLDFHKRLTAVSEFQNLPEATNLAAANKRVHNLLGKNPANNKTINPKLIAAGPEQELLTAIEHKEKEIAPLHKHADYSAILCSLASLQVPVDNFFNSVMVMDENTELRNNRLNLLQRLRNLFLEVADVSLL